MSSNIRTITLNIKQEKVYPTSKQDHLVIVYKKFQIAACAPLKFLKRGEG